MVVWSLLLIALFGASFFVLSRSGRSSGDVLADLSEFREEVSEQRGERPQAATHRKSSKKRVSHQEDDEFFQAGFLRREDRIRFEKQLKRQPWIVGLVLGSIAFVATRNPFISIICFVAGLTGAYLYGRRKLYNRQQKFLYDIDYYLPIVMERLVMTAQAGLDVFSGIRVIGELARSDEELLNESVDPVTLLLERVYHLNERGIGFEDALSQVAAKIESPALRHSFIHLAIAQKEGGELVSPLRELSDSTQAYFQETIEEQIAKLPVKATMPLMLTFAGLVIFFMTSPMMQIMKLTTGGLKL
jgi:Flp pilus assembly protein TadB